MLLLSFLAVSQAKFQLRSVSMALTVSCPLNVPKPILNVPSIMVLTVFALVAAMYLRCHRA